MRSALMWAVGGGSGFTSVMGESRSRAASSPLMSCKRSSRSAAAGTERRWNGQRELIERLATTLAGSTVWDLVRRQSRGRGPAYGALREDAVWTGTIIVSVAVVAIVVLSFIVLKAAGLLD